MSDEISFEVGCRIMLDGWRWRQKWVAEPLQEYHQDLLLLLCEEFGVVWPEDSDDLVGPQLLSMLPRHYSSVTSVFSGILEYRFVAGEEAVISRHREALEADEGALKDRYAALFHDLMLLRWPEASGRRTSWSRLRSLGLGESVDEFDFL